MKRSKVARLLRLAEFSDSAFPVGAFSFSNGLETAVAEGLVHDAVTLEAFTEELPISQPNKHII